jgi:simple sugar transport system ATP-binding protein
VQRFDLRTPTIETPASSLSGGNKQKLIVARELATEHVLVIAAQPTRGIDVGSIEFIHRQLVAARDAGAAILLVSAELDEILTLADRIAVMYEGRIVATLDAAEATRERIGLLMAGAG